MVLKLAGPSTSRSCTSTFRSDGSTPGLPMETAKAITTRAYRGFPDTPTISDLDLSRSEVSLLAQLCSWVPRQHADLLRDALA